MGDGVLWGMGPATLISLIVVALLITALIKYNFI
jgi:hypothetical protein